MIYVANARSNPKYNLNELTAFSQDKYLATITKNVKKYIIWDSPLVIWRRDANPFKAGLEL